MAEGLPLRGPDPGGDCAHVATRAALAAETLKLERKLKAEG